MHRLPAASAVALLCWAAPAMSQSGQAPGGAPAGPGAPQPSCAPYERIEARLAARWGEAPAAFGVTAGGNLIVVFRNAETDSWTLLVRSPDGVACALQAGTGWVTLAPAPAGTVR